MLMRTRVRARGKVAVIAGFSLLWSKDVVANTLKSLRNGAVGFIDWLDLISVQLANDGFGVTYRMSAQLV